MKLTGSILEPDFVRLAKIGKAPYTAPFLF